MLGILLLAGLFTWGMTLLGASLIFFFKDIKQLYLDSMLGFAAGVMICASFTSLILPAIDYANNIYSELIGIFIVCFGIISGTLLLMLIDRILPHFHPFENIVEGVDSSLSRSILLVFAITLHNIPEGLAMGVAYGSYFVTKDPVLLTGAISLTIGIGIQNFPEGSAVSFPLVREGFSKKRSFFYGQLSAIVEPVMIFVGFYMVSIIHMILPYFLGFAAGAMMFVVIEELIPESQSNKNIHAVTIFTMLGLIVMLVLDVMLG